jgi:hypothetical protein
MFRKHPPDILNGQKEMVRGGRKSLEAAMTVEGSSLIIFGLDVKNRGGDVTAQRSRQSVEKKNTAETLTLKIAIYC